MKHTIFFFVFSVAFVFAQPPWPGVPYTKVRAFVWRTTDHKLVRDDMSFAEGVLNKDGVLLNAAQTKRLLAAQALRYTDRAVAGCYDPHNAFVFYNAENKPVAFLEICFDCFGSRTGPPDDKCDPNFLALASLCAELKIPIGLPNRYGENIGKPKTVADYEKEFRMIFGPDPQTPPRSK